MDDMAFDTLVTNLHTNKSLNDISPNSIDSLTSQQCDLLIELCIAYDCISSLFKIVELSSDHVDLLLRRDHAYGRYLVFRKIPILTSEQIGRGLDDDDIDVRHVAHLHPCCTEAQKVKYLLKWSE